MAFHQTFTIEFRITIHAGTPRLMLVGMGMFFLSATLFVVSKCPINRLAPLVAVGASLASSASLEGSVHRRCGAKRAHWQAIGFSFFRHGAIVLDTKPRRTGNQRGSKLLLKLRSSGFTKKSGELEPNRASGSLDHCVG